MKSELPQFSIRWLFAVTVLAAIPLSGVTCILKQRKEWRDKLESLKKQDAETLKQIVIDVEEICAKLGRVPDSQHELESFLGRKMPKVHDNGYPTPINYWRSGDDSYRLQFELWATDDWVFDSKIPDAGWVQHFY